MAPPQDHPATDPALAAEIRIWLREFLSNRAWGFLVPGGVLALTRFLGYNENSSSYLPRIARGRVWIYPRNAAYMHARIKGIREGRWKPISTRRGIEIAWCDPPRQVPRTASTIVSVDFRGVHLGIMPLEPPKPAMPSPSSLFKRAVRS